MGKRRVLSTLIAAVAAWALAVAPVLAAPFGMAGGGYTTGSTSSTVPAGAECPAGSVFEIGTAVTSGTSFNSFSDPGGNTYTGGTNVNLGSVHLRFFRSLLTSTVHGASVASVSIAGTAMTTGTVTGSALAAGMQVKGTGVTANTRIVSGAGSAWVVDTSQTVGPITATIGDPITGNSSNTTGDKIADFACATGPTTHDSEGAGLSGTGGGGSGSLPTITTGALTTATDTAFGLIYVTTGNADAFTEDAGNGWSTLALNVVATRGALHMAGQTLSTNGATYAPTLGTSRLWTINYDTWFSGSTKICGMTTVGAGPC